MSTSMPRILEHLTDSAWKIIAGDYQAAQHLFTVTANESEAPECRHLAETLGMMAVKLEAREFALEQKLEVIQEQKREIENAGALRAESGFLFCAIILLLSGYTILLAIGKTLGWFPGLGASYATMGLLGILMCFFAVYARRHKHAWATWGLTWKGGRKALAESLLVCALSAPAIIGLKWWLVRQSGTSSFGRPVFSGSISIVPAAAYLISAIGQEIISRGFIQSTLERVLVGKHQGSVAIVTSSVLFAVAHLHYSNRIVLATMFSGFVFGWLYRRHRTLVGVCIAHVLLGTLAIDILGLI